MYFLHGQCLKKTPKKNNSSNDFRLSKP
uniref:Uncharacterized protein n=1 Tax=Anguilla anguilla TaxID=7936 RepID=A0A0E9QH03_ANGAN